MIYNKVYAKQPYIIGQKERHSIAIIIPSPIVKEFRIDKNTIFIVRAYKNRKLAIETIIENENINQKEMIPVDKSFQASGQQVSTTQ